MWCLPDNNADGAEGTIPYKYLDFCRFLLVGKSGEKSSSRGGDSGVYIFEECIVFCTVLSRGIK